MELEAPKASQLNRVLLVRYVHNSLQALREHRVALALGALDSGATCSSHFGLVIHPSPLYERAKAPRLARVETSHSASVGWHAHSCQVLSRLLSTRSCSGSGPLHRGLPPG